MNKKNPMITIVYFKCLCKSSDKLKAKQLKESHSAEIRVINKHPEWMAEARTYGIKLPIIVQNGQARALYE